ncbi:MAG: hypothetical protein Q9169_005713 [Polycauliona sp. 2 TL-2023]
MLRRFSTRFTGKKKDESRNKALTNGTTNGTTNGDHKRTELAVQHPDAPDFSVIQDDVSSNFEKFAHFLHASDRPLPPQSGDGAQLEEGHPSGFMQDLRTFGFKDINTVMQVMKTKATGELQEFHNYVVEQLAVINENDRFSKPRDSLPDDMKAKLWAKRDHDIFNTGRLVTCGLYINITLYDYLRTIVNLNRSNTTWTLDPRAKMGNGYSSTGTPSGVGNAVSAEFNLAYRWHSCISEKDDEWTQNLYKELFGKSADEVSFQELLQGLGKWEQGLDPDPQKRPFAKLQRGADGKYPDEGLARILTESVEDVAGAFGANNIPKCLRAISMLGLQQGRKWNLGSFNEFRKFFGLQDHKTFEDINPDPTVADSLRHLYEHPDKVEIYTGLVSEAAKVPMVPGVGIAPTFTISRAVLSDAVALVRGDRFYTTDYTTKSLTNWGYSEVQYNLNVEQGWQVDLRGWNKDPKLNSRQHVLEARLKGPTESFQSRLDFY